MSKYKNLTNYLIGLVDNEIIMTFHQIEAILGQSLPKSAYDHRPWWANRNDGNGSQSLGWQDAGWKTNNVRLDTKKVTFTREIKIPREDKLTSMISTGISIDEAKSALAVRFGVPAQSIEIHIRG